MKEMNNFKKPEKLRSLLVEVNTIEGEGDRAYVEATHELFGSTTDAFGTVDPTASQPTDSTTRPVEEPTTTTGTEFVMP